MAAVILEPKKIKSVTVFIFPYLFAMNWWDWMPWSSFFKCWVLSQLFHSPLSCSSRGSSLSSVRVVSSAYLSLLIFLLAILIPACASSSLAFHMYSAYKLNKQGDNIQTWGTPFPIWIHPIVPCLVPTVASWSAWRFLRRQVRWSGIPIPLRIFQFVVIPTVKGFSIVNDAEVDFFWNSLAFLYDPMDVGNLISGSSAFSKIQLVHLEVLGSHTAEACLPWWLRW